MGRDAGPEKGDGFLGSFVWGAERPGDPRREDARREADAGAPRRTGITRRDVKPPSGEVAFEGRRWRVNLYLADPLGERDLLELASEGSTIRLLGHFGADGEFMVVHRTRMG
jgi:hypothetical protein